MGALIIPDTEAKPEAALIHQADMPMYAAKHSGRSAVKIGWWCGERPECQCKYPGRATLAHALMLMT
jgi:hypothetical protein